MEMDLVILVVSPNIRWLKIGGFNDLTILLVQIWDDLQSIGSDVC